MAEGETLATKDAAVAGRTVAQGDQPVCYRSVWIRRTLSVGASPSADRLFWLFRDLGFEKNPSTITLYGRDISNKIPISSERERKRV